MDNFFSATKATTTRSPPLSTMSASTSPKPAQPTGSSAQLHPPNLSVYSSNRTSPSHGVSQGSKQAAVIIDLDADDDSIHQPRPSPREAAAAAAMARFDRQLKAQNRDTSPSTTAPASQEFCPVPSKRKDTGTSELTASLTIGAGSVKRIKKEQLSLDQESTRDTTIAWPHTPEGGLQEEEDTPATAKQNRFTTLSPSPPQPVVVFVSSHVECPICSQQVEEATINDHVDLCIWRTSGNAD